MFSPVPHVTPPPPVCGPGSPENKARRVPLSPLSSEGNSRLQPPPPTPPPQPPPPMPPPPPTPPPAIASPSLRTCFSPHADASFWRLAAVEACRRPGTARSAQPPASPTPQSIQRSWLDTVVAAVSPCLTPPTTPLPLDPKAALAADGPPPATPPPEATSPADSSTLEAAAAQEPPKTQQRQRARFLTPERRLTRQRSAAPPSACSASRGEGFWHGVVASLVGQSPCKPTGGQLNGRSPCAPSGAGGEGDGGGEARVPPSRLRAFLRRPSPQLRL